MNISEINDSIESIAIVGLSCRFPGAMNVEEFWQNLCDGVESISFFTNEELEAEGVDPALLRDPNYVKAHGYLENVDLFDASFFGFTPREAEITDPQHRLFLECAWAAIENAGYDSERYQGTIGIYASEGLNSYLLNNLIQNRRLIESAGFLQISIGNEVDHLATQTAYKLNLRGPSVTVQTACSSSLVAVHMACQSLLTYQCDMALAGGVRISLPAKAGYLYQEGGISSADGHCRAFDAKADGTVAGSGVGIVVMKRLADAISDGDCIYATIKGTAMNNDGSGKIGYTAPSVSGQAKVIAMAQAVAGVEPETITYIEAHGTGTPLGDPIEMEALQQVFRAKTKSKNFCALGSVKTNLGHLDTAAGIAGLIKTALSIKHKLIPPSLHFESPNPKIDFANSAFYVNNKLQEWNSDGTPRRAGVSSFGIGGTNVHVILEEAPQMRSAPSSSPYHLLILSAKTNTALQDTSANLAVHLKQNPEVELADIAYTLQLGRRAFDRRRAVVCQSHTDAISALETLDLQRVVTGTGQAVARNVTFMFPGQGSQYVNMGRELYLAVPPFREQVDLCSNLLLPHLGFCLTDTLYPEADNTAASEHQLMQTYITQPLLFVIEYALAKLWMRWGVQPQAMIGHSIGEYVAACLAGVFSLEDALRLVAARGKLAHSIPGGAMLFIQMAEKDLQRRLGDRLWLSAINSPSSCTVAGEPESVSELEKYLEEQGVACRRLRTSHAFHSGMMDPILSPFADEINRVKLQPPCIPYISNVTGAWMTAAEAMDPDYWVRHLRQTVRFSDGISQVFDPDTVLLEVGPGRTLMTIARWHPRKAAGQIVLTSLPSPDVKSHSVEFLLRTLGQLWVAGIEPDWQAFHNDHPRRRIGLPTYPFERQRYWIEAESRPDQAASQQASLDKKANISEWFYVPSWKRSVLPHRGKSNSAEGVNHRRLFFVDDTGLGSKMADALEREEVDVVTVAVAKGFSKVSERLYTIDPRRRDDYSALFKELSEQGRMPGQIVHMWNVTSDRDEGAEGQLFEKQLDLSFYSLLFLVQAIGAFTADPIRIVIVSNNVQEVIGFERLAPEKAVLLGPCKVVPQEYPNITCRSIDISLPESESAEEDDLINNLLAELTQTGDPIVAYRRNHRWLQSFEAIQLDKSLIEPMRLKEGGVYLITGGLGGIGLALAEHLASTARAKLALIGRTKFPAREEWGLWLDTHDDENAVSKQIRKLLDLEKLGSEVMTISADVSSEEQMREAVARINNEFGQVNGVIHSAGVAGGGMIQLRTPEAADAVFAPKIRGTRILQNLFENVRLDFLALCSSRSSILGAFGAIDYCAANSFLDSFAHYNTNRNGPPTVSINWPAWQEVGMMASAAGQYQTPQVIQQGDSGHPLLGMGMVERDGVETFRSKIGIATHWILDEHRILGNAVIPGVTYLEMARAAFEQKGPRDVFEIRDTYFLTPLGVKDDEIREIRITLEEDKDGFEFQVSSNARLGNDNESNWEKHAIGRITLSSPRSELKHDIDSIKARCNLKDLVIDQYLMNEDHGPRWQSLKRVYIGSNELLAFIDLPDQYSDDLDVYGLHPALMDRSAGLGMLFLLENQTSYIPFSYGRVRVSNRLQKTIYTYVKYKQNALSSEETVSFDLVIMGVDGTELVKIEDLTHKRIVDRASGLKSLAGGNIAAGAKSRLRAKAGNEDQSEDRGHNPSKRVLSDGLSQSEGREVFSRILSRDSLPQIIVSPNDLMGLINHARGISHARAIKEVEKIRSSNSLHARPAVESSYALPRNELEGTLIEIWQEILGIEPVGIHDNFFELGGDSVQAIQIVAKANKSGLKMTVQQLFQRQTVAELAALIGTTNPGEAEYGVITGDVQLTPIQRWFIQQDFPTSQHFNRSLLLDTEQRLSSDLLEKAVRHLFAHHDGLRLRFRRNESEVRQFIAEPDEETPFSFIDLAMQSIAEQTRSIQTKVSQIQASMNLDEGPLAQVVFFDLGPERGGKLLFVIHYLVADRASCRILLEDLELAYEQLSRGEAIKLRPKTTSYKYWAERLTQYSQSEALSNERIYWAGEVGEKSSPLPVDYGIGDDVDRPSRFVSDLLGVEESRSLNEALLACHLKMEDLLLTALARAFKKYGQESALLVECQGDGRVKLFDDVDLSRTVGQFTALVPISLSLGGASDPGGDLKSVKEKRRRVPTNGIGYGVLRYLNEDLQVSQMPGSADSAQLKFYFQDDTEELLPASRMFKVSQGLEDSARSSLARRGRILEVNCVLKHTGLQVELVHSESLYKKAMIENLATTFMGEIKSLINYCNSQPVWLLGATDFPLAQLDEEKFDKLSSLLESADSALAG